MNINKPVKPNTIGVIIGRFQVHSLHDGHKSVIDEVIKHHNKVLILIGCKSDVLLTQKNPLDFYTRKLMIEASYPKVVISPIVDMPDNNDWSGSVDQKIKEAFGSHSNAIIYGSRDSFIPFYSGKYEAIELRDSVALSGTETRSQISDKVIASDDFRSGVIYAAFNRHPVTYCTVDIVIQKDNKLLLARKFNDPENKWRFIGGFVDPLKDESFLEAAKRECLEETSYSTDLSEISYLGSLRIDDWRYRGETDQVMTTVFHCQHKTGHPLPSDDIQELKWFEITDDLEKDILAPHIPILHLFKKGKLKNVK